MCNLLGYSGRGLANPLSIKLLAIYGNKRGKDSFGIYINGKIFKYCGYQQGVDLGDSYHLIFGNILTQSKSGNSTIIGHNRQRSVGSVNVENAHPFKYNFIENRTFLFAHNGTIKNIDELAKKYNIEKKFTETDSKVLGEIIYLYGFDVLTEYTGYAAFSLYHKEEDTLYLWKGFSQCDSATPCVERSLYFYNHREKFYYASEELALITAMNTDRHIFEVPDNTLLTIKGGKIINEEVFDRSHIVYEKPVYTTTHNNHFSGSDDYAYSRGRKNSGYKPPIIPITENYLNSEPCPQNIKAGKIYLWKCLYYVNGHPLSGIYIINESNFTVKVDQKDIVLDNIELYHFFHKGYMINNLDNYLNITRTDGFYNLLLDEKIAILHPDSIITSYMETKNRIFRGGSTEPVRHGELVRPLYSDNSYYSSDTGVKYIPNNKIDSAEDVDNLTLLDPKSLLN